MTEKREGSGDTDGPGGTDGVQNGESAGRIRRLDDRTIDRIAAGEVVERPASAVKELLENALDADASRVRVRVEGGGIEGIRVTDDGIGMDETDARRAVEKHTTSKISDISDIEGGVSSLGFRGEALAAISAIARLTIRTKPRGGTRGIELVVEGGEIESVSPVGCPAGTTIEVSDLFYNVPARRKYLKREATEFTHVNRIVAGYALANPEVAITLSHGSRETFATSGSGDLREAVLSVYGREVATAMISLDDPVDENGENTADEDHEIEGDDTESSIERIGGVISEPETTRSNASYVTTIVNGRYVTARAIREAILRGYGTQLAPDRYPFAVLSIDVPAAAIDVNVHPRKLEVRFEDEATIKSAIEDRVERALLEKGLVRSGAPRGRSAPQQARIDPEPESGSNESKRHEPTTRTDRSEREREVASDDPERDGIESADAAAERDRGDREDRGANDGSANPDAEASADDSATDRERDGNNDREPRRSDRRARGKATERGSTARTARASAGDENGSERNENGAGGADVSLPDAERGRPAIDSEGVVAPHAHIDETAARSSAERTRNRDRFEAGEQRALSGEAIGTRQGFDRLPGMRVLGQFDGTYVVAETTDGLVLIDQHAADERITFEELRERLPRGEAQVLAEPVEIELTASEAALFESAIDALSGLGFYASWAENEDDTESEDDTENEDKDGSEERTIRVRTVPAAISGCDPALLRDVLSAFVSAERPSETIDAAAEALLADLACYPSITANTSLSEGSMLDLLEALDECENPYACPHGRPVVIEFSTREIADRFERDYPGHAGRRSEFE